MDATQLDQEGLSEPELDPRSKLYLDFKNELEAQGLPPTATLADLIRHHRGNAATVGVFQAVAIYENAAQFRAYANANEFQSGDYTPDTLAVRLGYAYRPNLPEGERHHPPLLAEFDRWIMAHDAELLNRLNAAPVYPMTHDQSEAIHERAFRQYPFNIGYAAIFEHGIRTALTEMDHRR